MSGEYDEDLVNQFEEDSRQAAEDMFDSNGNLNAGFVQDLLGGNGLDPNDFAPSDAKLYRTDGSSGIGNISPGADIKEPSLMERIVGGASGWIKDNKELATMIGSGIAGAVKDKNAREMSQAQIDYYKQRQQDLNGSVKSYTRNPNKA